ncbi:FAD-dependent oxidoreductase [Actinomadura rudentiformis]|uniref:FAD-dependent oxidoreductase n=1 Tax=Actinomadura rudentiformis TaxID=359158 RepID=A0A6H9Y9Y9_9ACTN|nr:FAD-dependent oxidoreductase [Actinomadura rudentiformis]KAB2340401.1 FAD-dependent oxidoreductase [Actinomadura rudentiformis]
METYDVVVLGTGAAGLTAALAAHDGGARVGLFEKASQVGGTTAWSGGMVWIPGNPHMADLGLDDDRVQALTYLESLSHGLMDPDLAAAFVDTGPEAVLWLEAKTPVEFRVIPGFPDYHSEHPGAKRGRSLETLLFPFDRLGPWAERVTTGYQITGNIMMGETSLGRGAPGGVPEEELARRRIHDERGAGQGLAGALLAGCLDRGIEPRTGSRAVELIVDDGQVTGVRFETATGPLLVRATAGVVLATGGFEGDAELVRAFLRGPMERPVSTPTNTGDGLRMAMRVGASLGNMREAWWVPTIDIDHPQAGRVPWQVNGERSKPHCIMVNRAGRRFANEAANYNALGAAFHVLDVTTFDYVNHPAWMVFDHHYLTRYGLAGHRPDHPTPSWMIEAPTVEKLACALDIRPETLTETVERWNRHADADPDFGRGDSVTDRWWGDPALGDTAASTIGPLDTAPFYAVQVRSGTLGTKGGPRTDTSARVLDVDGRPIPGLYAAGNTMASVMHMTYGGAGGTLGPAIVFGYIAGRHAAGETP